MRICVHTIVTGGGLTPQGSWRPSGKDFLVPEKPLALLFRAKLRDELKKGGLFAPVDQRVWKKDWVVDCEPVGTGAAAFKYLPLTSFAWPFSNNRIRALQNGHVTFAYKDSATAQTKFCTITAEEFIRRFLQHVLPPRFIKVRYYGLLSPSHRHLLAQARKLLLPNSRPESANEKAPPHSPAQQSTALLRCPNCGGLLLLTQTLKPHRGRPP